METMRRKCPICGEYVDISDWPIYKGKMYSSCCICKRWSQKMWARNKREMLKGDFYEK